MSETTDFFKAFVQKHKTAITVITTATATTAFCMWLAGISMQQHNDFLKDHGLWEEFCTMEE